jgi:hypothetical protein
MVFDEVAKKMVGAFEKRCEQLYGPSSLKAKRKRTFGTRTSNAVGTYVAKNATGLSYEFHFSHGSSCIV